MRIIITGEIQVGKSRILDRIRKQYHPTSISGFLSCPIIKNKINAGYYLQSLNGKREIFAHVDFDKRNQFGPFGVKLEVFNTFAVRILEQATEAKLIIMDELGIMEKNAVRFVEQIVDIFQKPKNIIAVIQQRALNFWIARIGQDNIDLSFTVTEENRDILPEKITGYL